MIIIQTLKQKRLDQGLNQKACNFTNNDRSYHAVNTWKNEIYSFDKLEFIREKEHFLLKLIKLNSEYK